MSAKRLFTFCIASTIAFTTLTCKDAADPLSPVEPQYAKPDGPPGLDKDPVVPVELLEYYIYQEDGKNYVHMLAKGSFPMVNLNVVQDYIFNGIRDDDDSIFYEYTTFAPDPVGVDDLTEEGLWEFDENAQAWHIDIPWNGETWYRDYDLPDSPRFDTYFPDFPHVGLNGGTADPYAFDIKFQKENGDYIEGYQPQGIILGGEEKGEWEMDHPAGSTFHDGIQKIYSYATYESTRASKPIYIDEIFLDVNSLTCEIKTIRERIDRVNITREVTEVSGTARVILSAGEGEPLPEGWIDVMFAEYTGDLSAPELVHSFASTSGSEPWATGWGVSAQFDGALESLQLQLAVPYVYATDLKNGTVYDPSSNNDGNGSEWYTINVGSISAPGSWPIALTVPYTVNCGK